MKEQIFTYKEKEKKKKKKRKKKKKKERPNLLSEHVFPAALQKISCDAGHEKYIFLSVYLFRHKSLAFNTNEQKKENKPKKRDEFS